MFYKKISTFADTVVSISVGYWYHLTYYSHYIVLDDFKHAVNKIF